jgi:hypothetical protein
MVKVQTTKSGDRLMQGREPQVRGLVVHAPPCGVRLRMLAHVHRIVLRL